MLHTQNQGLVCAWGYEIPLGCPQAFARSLLPKILNFPFKNGLLSLLDYCSQPQLGTDERVN